MTDLYIGLMSGTSMDGIDTALVDFSDNKLQLVSHYAHPIPAPLKEKLSLLALDKPDASLDLLGETDAEMGELFADSVLQLVKNSPVNTGDIKAIGSHGQTIRHRPDLKHSFSMQIGDANRIAFKTGITTVSDFRRKDMAAGGEGAPLTPAFHRHFFSSKTENRAVLNIGGIANITYLPANKNEACFGFDSGPGNMLMDGWIQKQLNKDFDKNGDWAASANVDENLLSRLMSDPFIHAKPPKSTGREHYNLDWLNQQLINCNDRPVETIQATLNAFTARSIQYSIDHFLPEIQTLLLCGGGAHNRHLINQLQQLNPQLKIHSSEDYGLHPDWVEAVAFAWLARQTITHQPGNLPEVTGAKQAVILGAIYPA